MGGGRARDRKGVQIGKRSLFSKTRPSRADIFLETSPNILLQNKLYLISPLRSKRATLDIDPHGRVCCFGAAKPGRRAKARRVFAFGPFCHTDTHTIHYSNSHTAQTSPIPPQPYLQGTRPFGRSYYNVHSYLPLPWKNPESAVCRRFLLSTDRSRRPHALPNKAVYSLPCLILTFM
jgi:hypothetical protein